MADGDHGRLRAGLTHLKHRVLVDAAEAYGAMAPVVPLRRFRPLVADRDFYQEIGLLQVNQLGLMSYASAPVQLMLEPTASVQLVAGFSGCWLARTPEGVLASRAGCGLLLPSGPIEVRGGSSSAVMAMQPADLTRAAAAMAGNTSTLAPTALAAPSICRFQARELSVLQSRQLHALLQHLDACLGSHPALPARLGLDDVLLRLVVSWLQPQLLEETAADRRRIHRRAGGSSFDELIDTIRANLDGTASAMGGGLGVGVQFELGPRVYLDLNAGYGMAMGDAYIRTSDPNLEPEDYVIIKENIEKYEDDADVQVFILGDVLTDPEAYAYEDYAEAYFRNKVFPIVRGGITIGFAF